MTVVNAMRQKWRRDEELPLSERLWKVKRYVVSTATAPLLLHSVQTRGAGVRCIGRPSITNLGEMQLGDRVVLRSSPVSVELATGSHGLLVIGALTSINTGASIHADCSVQIGERVRIAPYVHIMDTAFHDLSDHNKRPPARPVVIEDDVVVGGNCGVYEGTVVRERAVLASGVVLTRGKIGRASCRERV